MTAATATTATATVTIAAFPTATSNVTTMTTPAAFVTTTTAAATSTTLNRLSMSTLFHCTSVTAAELRKGQRHLQQQQRELWEEQQEWREEQRELRDKGGELLKPFLTGAIVAGVDPQFFGNLILSHATSQLAHVGRRQCPRLHREALAHLLNSVRVLFFVGLTLLLCSPNVSLGSGLGLAHVSVVPCFLHR